MSTKVVTRLEDMSARGYLKLMRQIDGDIIVAVYPEKDGLVQAGSSVEFCAMFSGGGRSPHTLAALEQLMVAMEKDNEFRPDGAR